MSVKRRVLYILGRALDLLATGYLWLYHKAIIPVTEKAYHCLDSELCRAAKREDARRRGN